MLISVSVQGFRSQHEIRLGITFDIFQGTDPSCTPKQFVSPEVGESHSFSATRQTMVTYVFSPALLNKENVAGIVCFRETVFFLT